MRFPSNFVAKVSAYIAGLDTTSVQNKEIGSASRYRICLSPILYKGLFTNLVLMNYCSTPLGCKTLPLLSHKYILIFFTTYYNSICSHNFHRIGQLGRFDLVVAMSVCLCVCLMSLFMWYTLRPILPPLPKVGCPKFLEIQNPWGKVLKEVVSELNIFVWKWSKIATW